MLLKTYECRRISVEQTLPSRENKNVWKKLPPYISCTIPAAPPLVAGATTFPPYSGGTMGAGHFGQSVLMAAAAEKPYNRAYARGKCTPSAACGGVSPGGGDSSGAIFCATYETGR